MLLMVLQTTVYIIPEMRRVWDLGAPYGVESILLRTSALRSADRGAIGHFPRESAGRR